jgi:hypothetical protein
MRDSPLKYVPILGIACDDCREPPPHLSTSPRGTVESGRNICIQHVFSVHLHADNVRNVAFGVREQRRAEVARRDGVNVRAAPWTGGVAQATGFTLPSSWTLSEVFSATGQHRVQKHMPVRLPVLIVTTRQHCDNHVSIVTSFKKTCLTLPVDNLPVTSARKESGCGVLITLQNSAGRVEPRPCFCLACIALR